MAFPSHTSKEASDNPPEPSLSGKTLAEVPRQIKRAWTASSRPFCLSLRCHLPRTTGRKRHLLTPAPLALPLPRPGLHRRDNQRQGGLLAQLRDQLLPVLLGTSHARLDEIVTRRSHTETMQPGPGRRILALDLLAQPRHLARILCDAHACSSCCTRSPARLLAWAGVPRRWPSRKSAPPSSSDPVTRLPIHPLHCPAESRFVQGAVKVTMMPAALASTPAALHRVKSQSGARRTASKVERYLRRMISTLMKSKTIERHQITTIAAWGRM